MHVFLFKTIIFAFKVKNTVLCVSQKDQHTPALPPQVPKEGLVLVDSGSLVPMDMEGLLEAAQTAPAESCSSTPWPVTMINWISF